MAPRKKPAPTAEPVQTSPEASEDYIEQELPVSDMPSEDGHVRRTKLPKPEVHVQTAEGLPFSVFCDECGPVGRYGDEKQATDFANEHRDKTHQ